MRQERVPAQTRTKGRGLTSKTRAQFERKTNPAAGPSQPIPEGRQATWVDSPGHPRLNSRKRRRDRFNDRLFNLAYHSRLSGKAFVKSAKGLGVSEAGASRAFEEFWSAFERLERYGEQADVQRFLDLHHVRE